MKAIERWFQPDGVDTIKFLIKKVNSTKYNAMSAKDKADAIIFIEGCEKDLQLFKDEIKQLQ